MRYWLGLGLTMLGSPAMAQEAPAPSPAIDVVGTAAVFVKPDTVSLNYTVVGEGKTADEASRALAAKQKAIAAGLAGLLGRDVQLSASEVAVTETRSPECRGREYGERAQLSEGNCAPTGFVTTLQGAVVTKVVEKAGTAAGLAGRLGARDARISNFYLEDPAPAQRQATSAAIADARIRAQAMAAGAGVRLGPLLSLSDPSASDIRVSGSRVSFGESLPAPAPAPEPVAIDIAPRPIRMEARVLARFAIAR